MTRVRVKKWLMERCVDGKKNGEDWTNLPQLEEIFMEFAAAFLCKGTTPARVFITEHNADIYEVNPLVLLDTLHVNGRLEATAPKENIIQFRVNSRVYSIVFEGLSRGDRTFLPAWSQKSIPESIASLEAKLAAFPPAKTKHGECGDRCCLDANGNPIVADEVKKNA